MEEERLDNENASIEIQRAGQVGALLHMLISWYNTGMKGTPEEISQLTKNMFGKD